MPPAGTKRQKKVAMGEKIYDLLGKHKQVIVVSLINVSSSQVQDVRMTIRKGKGELVVGKNTVLNKSIQMRISGPSEKDPRRATWKPMPELERLQSLIVGKVGLIFTEEPISELLPKIEAKKRFTYARVGKLAPIDFIIPAGPTGLDPSQINFFHALQIPTKIQKSQIEILRDVHICTKGKKVTSSEAAFLQKLGHKPFQYGMTVLSMYDNGSIIGPELMSLTSTEIINRFAKHAKNVTALSIETGIPTEGSIIQSIFSAFKNLAAISTVGGYSFKQFSATATAAPAPAAGKTDAKPAKKEEPKEEPKKEEEETGMGGLFD